MLTDTKTRPEPAKTVDELWFELRVASVYGSTWDRQENAIALHWEREGAAIPEDVGSLLNELKSSVARRRPGINDFDPDPGFATEELGQGSTDDYWKTQCSFPALNRRRAKQHADDAVKLEKARQVLSRKVRT